MRDAELWEMQQLGMAGRRFSIPPSSPSEMMVGGGGRTHGQHGQGGPAVHEGHPPLDGHPQFKNGIPATSEDLHAWSIYRQVRLRLNWAGGWPAGGAASAARKDVQLQWPWFSWWKTNFDLCTFV